jgi:cytochrome P450
VSFLRDSGAFLREHRRNYGPVFKTHLFGQPTVVIGGVDAMRFMFTHDKELLVCSVPERMQKLLGHGAVSTQDGIAHQDRRRLLQQVLSYNQIAAHVPLMDRIVGIHLDRWEQRGSFAFWPLLNELTFHIACPLILGTEADIPELTALFQVWFAGLFSLPVELPLTKFSRAVSAREGLLARIEALAWERLGSARFDSDALSALLRATDEQGKKIPLPEIKALILDLLSRGQDTTSSALASFCLLTAQHPNVLDRLHAEQESLAIKGPLTAEHLSRMTYLDQVIKEVLRLIPPTRGAFRKVINAGELSGYQIPKGWTVYYSIHMTHQEASYFTAPDQFDPDRFGPERAEDKHEPLSWVPFGVGPRACMGLEYAQAAMAVLGARLAGSFSWELSPKQDLTISPVPTPRPKGGLQVQFRRL